MSHPRVIDYIDHLKPPSRPLTAAEQSVARDLYAKMRTLTQQFDIPVVLSRRADLPEPITSDAHDQSA